MKIKVYKVAQTVCIAVVLLYVALISIDLATGFYARYISSGKAADTARTAAWVFDVNDKESSKILDLTAVNQPGASSSYTFIVTNQRDKVTSEVAAKYSIEFEELGSLPLTYKLNDNLLLFSADPVDGENVVTEDENNMCFQAAVEANQEYTLTVEWPATENNLNYASGSGVASLRITILGEQID